MSLITHIILATAISDILERMLVAKELSDIENNNVATVLEIPLDIFKILLRKHPGGVPFESMIKKHWKSYAGDVCKSINKLKITNNL